MFDAGAVELIREAVNPRRGALVERAPDGEEAEEDRRRDAGEDRDRDERRYHSDGSG